ncbi:MAG: pyridoxamine 5'-phosphate oxidase family protein [Candidatus Saccharibacteria bacterium]
MKTQDMDNNVAGWQPTRKELSEFLVEQPLCVVSTLDQSGAPQSATVAFSETKDGQFIIGTSETSRKSQNIDSDSRVAMNVTDSEKRYTVQLGGLARKLSSEEFAGYADIHYDQLPASRPFKDQPGQVQILIQPTYIRFSDCSTYPWVLTEFNYDKV